MATYREFLKRPIVTGVIGFALGCLFFWGGSRWTNSRSSESTLEQHILSQQGPRLPNFDEFFGRDFFRRSNDPFKEMRRLHEQMLKDFGNIEGTGVDRFDSWFDKNFGGGSPEDFIRREDDQYVYYEITSEGGVPQKVDVSVQHGQVVISSEMQEQKESKDAVTEVSSTFYRTFPVPDDVEAEKFQVDYLNDKIVIKFPKKTSL